MALKFINVDISTYPADIQPFLSDAKLYDSSGGYSGAETIFIEKDNGYFLKSAPKGTLEREAIMGRYFHGKSLSPNVFAYISNGRDYMLTEKINGEDCTNEKYLAQPERLCDIFAERLAMLHSLDCADCPVPNHTQKYFSAAEKNFREERYDKSLFLDNWGYATAEEAWHVIETRGHLLQTNTLLHGDYCLPNIILDDWKFSGFIDLGNGGVGDRHVDIFWALWTLNWNLKTAKYRDRFIDIYGRAKVDEECLKIVAAFEVFG